MTVYAAEAIPLLSAIKTEIFNPLILLVFGAALIMFLIGVLEMVWGVDNPEKVRTGKQHIIWGIIGMTIMLSAFGIINLVCGTLELSGQRVC